MPNRTTTAFAILVGIIVMLATALTVTATRGLFNNDGAPAATPVVVDESLAQRSVPTLDAAQREQAVALATADPLLQALLGGQTPTTDSVVVWTDGEGTTIGAVVTLAFNQLVALSGDWLGLSYDPEERSSPPYQSLTYRAQYAGVSTLTVFVDLQRGQVAGFSANPEAQPIGTPEVPDDATIPYKPRD